MNIQKQREEIGVRLRGAREAAGLSQAQVARRLKLHRPSVSEMEAGRRGVDVLEMAQLADLYSTSIQWLTTGAPSSCDCASFTQVLNFERELVDRHLDQLRVAAEEVLDNPLDFEAQARLRSVLNEKLLGWPLTATSSQGLRNRLWEKMPELSDERAQTLGEIVVASRQKAADAGRAHVASFQRALLAHLTMRKIPSPVMEMVRNFYEGYTPGDSRFEATERPLAANLDGQITQDSNDLWNYLAGSPGAPDYNTAYNALVRLERLATFGALSLDSKVLIALKEASQRCLRFFVEERDSATRQGFTRKAAVADLHARLLESALQGWRAGSAESEAEKALLRAMQEEENHLGPVILRARDEDALERLAREALATKPRKGRTPTFTKAQMAQVRLAVNAVAAHVAGTTPPHSPLTKTGAAWIYELLADELAALHSSAADHISRYDNNQVFELPYFLRAVAERIRQEYDVRPGVAVVARSLPKPCVRCHAVEATLTPIITAIQRAASTPRMPHETALKLGEDNVLTQAEATRILILFSRPEESPAQAPGHGAEGVLAALRTVPAIREALEQNPVLLMESPSTQALGGVQAALELLRARAEEAEANLHALSEGTSAEALQRSSERENLVRLLQETQARFQSLVEVLRRGTGALQHLLQPSSAESLEQARPAFEAICFMLNPPPGAPEPGRWFSMAELEWVGHEVIRAFRAASPVAALAERLREVLGIHLIGFSTRIDGAGALPGAWEEAEGALASMKRILEQEVFSSHPETHAALRAHSTTLEGSLTALRLLWGGLQTCLPEALEKLSVGRSLGMEPQDFGDVVRRLLSQVQREAARVSPAGHAG